jgi:hypothetical protein
MTRFPPSSRHQNPIPSAPATAVPVAKNGPTSQFSGRLECWPHNRDADKHDHDAIALPPRPVTPLDELRARLHWRNRHYFHDQDDHDDQQTG